MKVAMSFAALLAIVSTSGVPLAAAHATAEVSQRTVKFGDLDLTRGDGAVALYARIKVAARAVCEPLVSASRDWVMSDYNALNCANQAIARAVADVNAPLLTAYYLSKSAKTRLAVANP